MARGKNYEKVRRYYSMGVWSRQMVYNAVAKDWITPEDYKDITGEDYKTEVEVGGDAH